MSQSAEFFEELNGAREAQFNTVAAAIGAPAIGEQPGQPQKQQIEFKGSRTVWGITLPEGVTTQY